MVSQQTSLAVLSDDISLLVTLLRLADRHGLALTQCRTPVAFMPYRTAVAQIADVSCGSTPDWRLFTAEMRNEFHAVGELDAPLVLVGDQQRVEMHYQRLLPYKPTGLYAFDRDHEDRLLVQVDLFCQLRRMSYG
jgi:hypothetical protein